MAENFFMGMRGLENQLFSLNLHIKSNTHKGGVS